MKKIVLIILCLAMVVCTITVDAQVQYSDLNCIRISGSSRYETANNISSTGWESSENVVIASGASFPDALAGVPLAYALECPVLLISDDNKSAIDEIKRLGATKAVILGGTSTISESVKAEIEKAGCTTTRIKGNDRFGTALEIAKYITTIHPVYEVFFAYAYNYADALSISVVAALKGAPILFMGNDGTINAETNTFLTQNEVERATVIGGTSSISTNAETVLSKLKLINERISGKDRHETNIKILNAYMGQFETSGICFASSKSFPDALSGSAYAANKGYPLMLVSDEFSDDAKAWMTATFPVNGVVFGGESSVSTEITQEFEKYIVSMIRAQEPETVHTYEAKTTGSVNMRNNPGTSGTKVLVTVPKGECFAIEDKQQVGNAYWYKVSYNDGSRWYTGWISGAYLLIIDVIEEITDPGEKEPEDNNQYGRVMATVLNVRSDAGTSFPSNGTVSAGNKVIILGSKEASDGVLWYEISYGKLSGYVSSKYITLIDKEEHTLDLVFEAEMVLQGFPESYKDALRELHEKYPDWVFVADHIEESWGVSVEQQYLFGDLLPSGWSGTKAVSVTHVTNPDSWKSKDSGAYNEESGTYVTGWDGLAWNIASREIIRYFMDPRNFLDESGIFQFIDLSYSESQTQEAVSAAAHAIGADWLADEYQHQFDSEPINYPEVITRVCAEYGFNPLALICIITQELGTNNSAVNAGYGLMYNGEMVRGRQTISGVVDQTINGYNLFGYYNYFNIGAYTDSTFNKAYLRGLYEANKKGWDTREKALAGGAQAFAKNYVDNGQNTLYYKRFNVINSTNSHQYSTDIAGPSSEATMLAKAYTESNRQAELVFHIPVYDNMPVSPCEMP